MWLHEDTRQKSTLFKREKSHVFALTFLKSKVSKMASHVLNMFVSLVWKKQRRCLILHNEKKSYNASMPFYLFHKKLKHKSFITGENIVVVVVVVVMQHTWDNKKFWKSLTCVCVCLYNSHECHKRNSMLFYHSFFFFLFMILFYVWFFSCVVFHSFIILFLSRFLTNISILLFMI